MPVKKKTTKKAAPKPAMKKMVEPIDELSDEYIASALESLRANPGWIIIKRILDENIFNQEKKILNTLFDKELKYNEEDVEKQIRRVYMDIRDLPDKEIARVTGQKIDEETYDPYFSK